MTTKDSPLSQLKQQADKIAKIIKQAERGEPVPAQFAERIKAARLTKENFTVGVVRDDKFIKIILPWQTIVDAGEAELSDFILKQMREERSS